jgi:phage tail protein X
MTGGKGFHHGAAEITEKVVKGKNFYFLKIDLFLRTLRISAVMRVFVFSTLLPLLQGCTLLFIQKPFQRFVEAEAPSTPPAKSLSAQMKKPVVLKYKAQEGDTLESVAFIYYSHASRAGKLAKANGLKPGSPLRVGMTLKVPDPVNFPNPKDLIRSKKTLANEDEEQDKSPVNHLDATPENITEVPRPRVNRAFGSGERLKYVVRALSMVGGYGTLEIGDVTSVNGRPCLPLTARATAAFPFSALYQVRDVQTSYFDAVDFLSWKFENDVLEGKHKAQNLEVFDQIRHKVTRTHNGKPPEEMDTAPFTQDIISCFYYFRLLPMKVGENYSIPTQAGGKNYNLIVEVVRKEKVTTPLGTFDCLLIKPHVRYETVFRNTDDINIWLTDDERRVPVLVRSAIFIGNVEATLMEETLPKLGKGPLF